MSNCQLTNFEKGKLREFALYRPFSYPELCDAYIRLDKSFDLLRTAMQTATTGEYSLSFTVANINVARKKE